MNRRSMLGMIGLGAAAGPAVVSQLGSQGSVRAIPSTGGEIYKDQAIPWNPIEDLSRTKREYEMITGDSSKWIADCVSREWDEYVNGYTSYRYETIEPDIRNMKSFSETAKMRMHIERKVKRKYESQKNYLWSRIQELMKQV